MSRLRTASRPSVLHLRLKYVDAERLDRPEHPQTKPGPFCLSFGRSNNQEMITIMFFPRSWFLSLSTLPTDRGLQTRGSHQPTWTPGTVRFTRVSRRRGLIYRTCRWWRSSSKMRSSNTLRRASAPKRSKFWTAQALWERGFLGAQVMSAIHSIPIRRPYVILCRLF